MMIFKGMNTAKAYIMNKCAQHLDNQKYDYKDEKGKKIASDMNEHVEDLRKANYLNKIYGGWLTDEYKQQLVDKGYRWLASDSNGNICAYKFEPSSYPTWGGTAWDADGTLIHRTYYDCEYNKDSLMKIGETEIVKVFRIIMNIEDGSYDVKEFMYECNEMPGDGPNISMSCKDKDAIHLYSESLNHALKFDSEMTIYTSDDSIENITKIVDEAIGESQQDIDYETNCINTLNKFKKEWAKK